MPAHPLRSAFRQGPADPPQHGLGPRLAYAREDVPGPTGAAAAPARILVVEDDFFVGLEAERTLVDAGFVVVGIAATAEEAIELAAREKPTLAVMDIRLASARDGVDAALELFRTRGLRCVFATAHADAEVRARAAPAAPLGWLQKPYTTSSLAEIVRQAVKELGAA